MKAAPNKFDGDLRDAALDVILDHSLRVLFPFLNSHNHAELADAVAEHLSVHLTTELGIVNGSLRAEATSPQVIELQRRFDERVER